LNQGPDRKSTERAPVKGSSPMEDGIKLELQSEENKESAAI